MQDELINRVANSGLVTLDLEEYTDKGERVLLDIKDQLFQGMLLREKDFREFIKNHNWEAYRGKHVALTCSSDAIVPKWAYMLLMQALSPYAGLVVFGNLESLEAVLVQHALQRINPETFRDQRVVVKGCGDKEIPEAAYVEITRLLTPVVKSILYGEPCSTVPVYKKK